jgi:hypothetical protein
MGGTEIRLVRISPAGRRVRLVMEPRRLDRSKANVSVRLDWEAYVVTYSLLRRSLERKLPPVVGFSILGERRTFRTLTPRVLPPFDRSRTVTPVARAVRKSGAKVVELDLFRPAGPALAVVVTSDRPAAFIARRLGRLITALNRVARRVDGFYVALTDTRRSVVFAYSRIELRATSSTTLWVRPDLLGCAEDLPVANEVAPDGAPPCPAA